MVRNRLWNDGSSSPQRLRCSRGSSPQERPTPPWSERFRALTKFDKIFEGRVDMEEEERIYLSNEALEVSSGAAEQTDG
jgi:hypothetical protein